MSIQLPALKYNPTRFRRMMYRAPDVPSQTMGVGSFRKWLGIALCMTIVLYACDAQTRTRTRQPEPKFTDNLWVGGSLNNNLRFGGGSFSFGLTPAAGYEIVKDFSMGVFVRFDYFYQRFGIAPPYTKFEAVDIGPGVFARVDILRQFFAQVEYEYAGIQRALTDDNGNVLVGPNGKVRKETIRQNYVYVGAGYMSGERAKFGMSIHYNILEDFDSQRFPWDFRFNVRVPLGGR